MRCSRCGDSGLTTDTTDDSEKVVCRCPAGKKIEELSLRLRVEAEAPSRRTSVYKSESAIHGHGVLSGDYDYSSGV
jgi:hypothetical protein